MTVTPDLLSIGDFSRMTFLTVKALRHYHDVGLLEPARIDPHSGYRFYRPEQVASARLIRRLRDLDLPVDDVRVVLNAPDEESRNRVILAHLDRMSRQLQETQETVDSLRRMLSAKETKIAIDHRDQVAGPAIAIRGRVDGESAVSWWLSSFTELHRLLRTSGVRRTGPDGAVFPSEFFTDGVAELVAFVPVEEFPPLPDGIQGIERNDGRFAVASYDGPMVDLDGAYSALGQSVTAQALAGDGPIVERYLPLGDEDDLLAHRTEVWWPIEH